MSSEISDSLLRDVNSQLLDGGEHEVNAVQNDDDVAGELSTAKGRALLKKPVWPNIAS